MLAFDVEASASRSASRRCRALHVARPRDQRAAATTRAAASRATRGFDAGARRPPARMGGAVGRMRHPRPARAARAAPAALPHLTRPAGVLAHDRPPRRRRAGARAQRRGLPRPRVLGRALRVSVSELPASRRSRAACCCTATGASARREAAAAAAGYRGAMYPWQSGSDGHGRDARPSISTRCRGAGIRISSRNQRHVNAALFYNIWQYYQATHDVDFLRDYGAEMMIEIARFWSSIAHFNPAARAVGDPRRDGP